MNLVNYEPFGLLHRFGRMYDDVYPTREGENDPTKAITARWSPAVDVREESDRYVIEADLPGVDTKAIDVQVEDGQLVIKGEREQEDTSEKNGYKRVERVRGSFFRRFTLPDIADGERIEARSENGVLTVSIPKQEKSQPRRIPVA